MARQRRPDKAPPVEQPTPLHRVASIVADWRVILAAAFGIFALGGIAYAFKDRFATKDDLAAVKTDVQVHNAELAGIHQAITDVAANQKQMSDWIRDIYDHPRK